MLSDCISIFCFHLNCNINIILFVAEQQKERKKEMARRLLEINARKREERLAEDEEQLQQLFELQVIFNISFPLYLRYRSKHEPLILYRIGQREYIHSDQSSQT